MATLVFDDVCFGYRDGARVLSWLTLEVGGPELMAVVGPTGSGKTTLLRLAAGLLAPTTGTVRVDGQPVTDLRPQERDIAVVFGWRTTYDMMTAERNMSFALDVRGYPRAEVHDRVGAEARVLRIWRLLSRKPRTLSVGQRQRVVLGRELVRAPRLLLLDEPFDHLEPVERLRLRRELSRLAKGLGVTTVLVTHQVDEAMAVADRVAVLRGGSIDQVGPPRQLYQRPATLFVASFMQPRTSVLHARLTADGGRAVAQVAGQRLSLGPLYGPLRAYVDRDVVIVIRPEDLRQATDDEPARLRVRVERVERLGAEAYVAGTYAPGTGIGVGGAEVLARFPPRTPVGRGDMVDLAVRPSQAHLFDPVTETVIHHGATAP